MAKNEDNGNKIILKIVVNGVPVAVSGNINAPLHTVATHALQEAGTAAGEDLSRWELTDEAGQVFDMSRKLKELGIHEGATLLLSLKAGVAG